MGLNDKIETVSFQHISNVCKFVMADKFENQIDFTVLSFAPIVMQNFPKIYWQNFCIIILTDANANGKYKIEKGMVQMV